MRRPPLAGILVTAALLVALAWFYRGRIGGPAVEPSSQSQAPRHGGQITAALDVAPSSFNPLVDDDPMEVLRVLTQGTLVRINGSTLEPEPWLAERWEAGDEGRTLTLHLRPGVTWSDEAPFTSEDVLFSVRAVLDPAVKAPMAGRFRIAGQPVQVQAPDPRTVVFTWPRPFAPGVRLLAALPILPAHKLRSALDQGTLASAWGLTTPPGDIVGTGPFVLRDYAPDGRIVVERNPRYWRSTTGGAAEGRLPYLDRIVLEVVPDAAERVRRLDAGTLDVTQHELRAEDYVPARRAEEAGRLRVIELGVAPGADAFWFCLAPGKRRGDPRMAFVERPEFRQAISHAVDREDFAHAVFAGEAVPVWGPVTPGNRAWFTPNVPRYAHDLARARDRLASIGLEDRNGNGVAEDMRGVEARFRVITLRDVPRYERSTNALRQQLAAVGIALEIVPVDRDELDRRLRACDYDAAYVELPVEDLDPGSNLDFWLSSGERHVWNPAQRMPQTEWEQRIDTLMIEQSATQDRDRRVMLFAEVQRIFAENVPVLYFVAPRIYAAHSPRVVGVQPSILPPSILWNADSLGVASAPPRDTR